MHECAVILVMCLISAKCYNFSKNEEELTLSVIHFNDFHARFDEVSPIAGICRPNKEECRGGIARMSTAIKKLMKTRRNPILLNAGDSYQGTLYYNLFKWNITQHFLNLLPIAVHTIGNHEFDDKVEGLVPFLKALKAPVVVSNINDTFHPEIQGLYQRSTVLNVADKKIGIVGVILSTTNEISNTEETIFLNEIENVNREADRLVKEEGVFTVIVLSHCGYVVEQAIAQGATKRIGLIVGAHSHTLLYNGTPPDNTTARGPYPTVVKRNLDGKDVLVVQASCYTKYLGDIVIGYDKEGEVINYKGNPVYLSPQILKDPKIERELKPYKDIVDSIGNEVLGETKVYLDSKSCRERECNFGNLITDAIIYCYNENARADGGCEKHISLALMNPGGIRTSIDIGNITYNDLVTAAPFENTLDYGILNGAQLKQVFDRTTRPYGNVLFESTVNLLQVSGFRIIYDLSKNEEEKVLSFKVRNECSNEFEDIDPAKKYRVIMNSILGRGGDGFQVISDNIKNYTVGEVDIDCLKRYVKHQSPIQIQTDGRLTFLNVSPIVKRK